MTGFSSAWLALREPADSAARSAALLERLRDRGRETGVRQIIDLGSGTGANLRDLAPRLGGRQDWLLVDDDPALLELCSTGTEPARAGAARIGTASARPEGARFDTARAAPGRGPTSGGEPLARTVRVARSDLATGLAALPWPDRGLVTASALLDLVSRAWLESLARHCAAAGAQALFALTYDGRIDLAPEEPEDGLLRELVNRHQRRDKGFGPALGPDAVPAAAEIFGTAGYAVDTAHSDWRLGGEQAGLQCALLRGWREAAGETAAELDEQLESWLGRRLAHVEAGRS
ncbi:MAG TPA: hypothetical protein VFY39_15165, partial [Gammaproteobacteria bacterium]|nr:hypothetical protein [Gammaproteobacteria bacterium]